MDNGEFVSDVIGYGPEYFETQNQRAHLKHHVCKAPHVLFLHRLKSCVFFSMIGNSMYIESLQPRMGFAHVIANRAGLSNQP